MTVVARARLVAGVAAVLLLALVVALLTAGGPAGTVALVVTAMLAAVGCVSFLAASFAGEQLLAHGHELEAISAARRERRRGRHVDSQEALGAIADGAGTPAELAEVLDVHRHVARRMLDALVAEGLAEVRDGLVVPVGRPGTPRRLPTAPRWIDPTVG